MMYEVKIIKALRTLDNKHMQLQIFIKKKKSQLPVISHVVKALVSQLLVQQCFSLGNSIFFVSIFSFPWNFDFTHLICFASMTIQQSNSHKCIILLHLFYGSVLSTEVPLRKLCNNYKNKIMIYVNNTACLKFLKTSIFSSLNSCSNLACLQNW